jgi:hypothetical protein
MAESQIIQQVENDARELRLTEQKLFREVLDKKQKKWRRRLFLAIAMFLVLAVSWMCLHCIPLVMKG